MSEICDADKESCQRLLLSSSSSIVESNSESEPNSSLGVDSESKEISEQAQVLDNNVIANYNIEPKANSAFVEDIENEIAATDFNLVKLEEIDKVEGPPLIVSSPTPEGQPDFQNPSIDTLIPVQNPQLDYRLNFNPDNTLLVSVPENALLPDLEHLAPSVKLPQSKESDSTSETQETYSESNSTAISASISSRTAGQLVTLKNVSLAIYYVKVPGLKKSVLSSGHRAYVHLDRNYPNSDSLFVCFGWVSPIPSPPMLLLLHFSTFFLRHKTSSM